MKSKKLSILLLLMLILIFKVMVVVYIGIINNDDTDLSAVRSKIIEIDQKLENAEVKIEDLELIMNGNSEVDVEGPVEGEGEGSGSPNDDTPPEDLSKKEEEVTTEMTSDASNLNVRSKPSTNGSVIATLNKGDKVESNNNKESANGYDWIEVTLPNGNKGWVVEKFLK